MNPVDGSVDLAVSNTLIVVYPSGHGWGEWHNQGQIVALPVNAAGLRRQLANGQFKIIRRGVVDGRKAIELAMTGLSPRMTGLHATAALMWVDAASYLRLRQVLRFIHRPGRHRVLPVPPADGREPGETACRHPAWLSPDLAAARPVAAPASPVNRWLIGVWLPNDRSVPSWPIGAKPWRVAAGSRLGEADRMRRPQGGLDAAAGSGTIGSREDGYVQHRSVPRMSWLICGANG